MHATQPWLKFYGKVPHSIDYPRKTMYECVSDAAGEYPDKTAYDFMGKTATYRQLMEQIYRCADALAALGIRKGDRMTISMPTSPPGVICYYALNKLGAVASVIGVPRGIIPVIDERPLVFFACFLLPSRKNVIYSRVRRETNSPVSFRPKPFGFAQDELRAVPESTLTKRFPHSRE
jgi:hypothetical protein